MATLSPFRHQFNPINNFVRLPREMKRRCFSSNQHWMMKFFPRIATAVTSHEASETLKKEFLGEKKVLTIKLQTLRREFETLAMKEKECVQDFLSRVSGVVSQMKIYGENISNETIVSKALRSLTKDFDHAVDAIDESSGLSKYSSDELMGSLVAMRSESTGPVKRWRRRLFK